MFALKEKELVTRVWQNTIKDCVIDLTWSNNGMFLAVATASGPITIFDSKTANPIIKLNGHKSGTLTIGWSADSKCFASSGLDGYIKLWDLMFKESRFILPIGEHLTWSPLKRFLVSSANNDLCLWDCDGYLLEEYPADSTTITGIVWRPVSKANSDLVFATSSYNSIHLWSPQHTKPLKQFESKKPILKMAWSPDGKSIATTNQDSTLCLWLVETSTSLQTNSYSTKIGHQLSWDSTSRYLATDNGLEIVIWDCSKLKLEICKFLGLNLHKNVLSQLAYQHKGNLLASAGKDGILAIWSPINNSQTPLFKRQYPSPIKKLAWSSDDKFLAVGCTNGLVEVLVISS